MPRLDANLDSISETPKATMQRLERSAGEWRFWGWFYIILASLCLSVMVVSAIWHPFQTLILPIYWFLLTWYDVSGIIFLYIYKVIKDLTRISTLSRAAVLPINRARLGLRLFIYLNIGMLVGCLIFYPPAAPFIIGPTLMSWSVVSKDREALLIFENSISKAVS